jgi:hypothetical protein
MKDEGRKTKDERQVRIPLFFGPYGSAALAYADRLAGYGANAAWFHGFDRAAFEACARHDVMACVEFKTFRANFDERPELRPIGVDGRPIRYGRLVQGVCLSRHEFLAETEEALLAGVRAYRPAGVWLDYLTYAGWFETPEPDLQQSCFCEDCIGEFNEATGLDATRPEVILKRYPVQWTRHKCERVAGHAAHYAEIIRAHLPGGVVGAYMCPWRPDEYDGALTRIFAQEYDLLAPAIDVFTPLIYAQKSGRPANWGRAFLDEAPGFVPRGRPIQLILDVLDYPDSLLAVAASSRPSWGIQVFGGAEVFGDAERARVFASAVERMRRTIDEGRRPRRRGLTKDERRTTHHVA